MTEEYLLEFTALSDEEKRLIMSSESSDAESSERKRSFWLRAIKAFCEQEKTACFEAEALAEFIFLKTGMMPKDVSSDILTDMRFHVVSMEDMLTFLEPTMSESKWNLFSKVYDCWKTFSNRFCLSRDSSNSATLIIEKVLNRPKIVAVEILKEYSKRIIDRIKHKNVTTIPLHDLYQDTQDFVDEATVKIAVLYMQKMSQCIVQKSPAGIKFLTVITNVDQFEPLSELELQLLELHERSLEIEEEMTRLFDRMKLCMEQAIRFKKQGCDAQAMHAMKVKKYYEFDQDRLTIELEQNLKMRQSLRQAEASIKMRRAGMSFNKTCHDIQTKSGATVDDMHEIIADSSEIFGESSDMMVAIKHSIERSSENIDEDELKKELDDLLALNIMQEFQENEMKEQQDDKTSKRKPDGNEDDAEVPPKRVLRGKK